MNLIVRICSILLLTLVMMSCRSQKVVAQTIDSVPIHIIDIKADTDSLIDIRFDMMLKKRENVIENQKREIHLLRTEIDALKKNMRFMEVTKSIDKLQDNLNQITKE